MSFLKRLNVNPVSTGLLGSDKAQSRQESMKVWPGLWPMTPEGSEQPGVQNPQRDLLSAGANGD